MKMSCQNSRPTQFYKSLLFGFCMLLPVITDAQNYLMENEQSGLHLGTQISRNSFENQYGLLPGYTYEGRLSMGIDIGKSKDLLNGINSTIIRPNISYLILKQNAESMPISFDLNAGYQINYVSQIAFNSRSVQFGLGIYHEIVPLDRVKLIPAIFVEGNKSTTGLNPRFDESVFMSYGVQASILVDNFYITPRFLYFDGITTIGVKFGIIFSSNKSEV